MIWEPVIYGMIGGGIAPFMSLYRHKEKAFSTLPEYFHSYFYLIIVLGMMILGGYLVHLYVASGIKFNPLLATNVGATAPLAWNTMIAKVPKIS